MANKRNHEWPLASVVDGFFTQDKAGGVTQRVPLSLIVSSIQGADVFQPLGSDLTAIEAISGTGVLTRTGTNTWAVVSAVAPSAHAASHLYGGGDALVGQSIPGLMPTNSPTWASVQLKGSGNSDLGFLSSAGSLRYIVRGDDTGDKWCVLTRNDDGSSRSERLRVPRSDASPVLVNLGLNVSSGALQLGGVDAITSTREGRFTDLRLTNLSAGQMPVCSDGNGQITASGETDDGTYFSSNRVLRLWNSLTKTGDTWTDFQWTQGVSERVSILSSNASGASACHSLVFAPADNEAAGMILGASAWAQKLAGKSGTNPGLKIVMFGRTVGAGGSVGGFGGQWGIQYRPDNGANLVDALRIGAFGGSTVDAVETAILLRATAGIESLGMTWAAYGGRTGLLPSSINPAGGVFGFSVDSTGEVDIGSPSETRMLIDGAEVLRLDTASIVSSRLLQTPNIKLTSLGEAGNLYADASGNVSVKTLEMFRGAGSVPVPDGIEYSVLGQSSSRRLIPANSVATGDELTLIVDFKSRVDANAQTWNIYIGPDGTYTASYRPSFTFSNQQLGNPTGNYNHRITFLVRFIVSGSDVICRGRMVIERSQFDAYNSGMDHVYSTDFTITYPRSSARFIDLTAQMSNANTSLFEFFLTSCVYRKAI